MIIENKVLVKNMIENNSILNEEESKMRETPSEEGEMRKVAKCANFGEITFYCELVGYDIKTLNTATGKGSYMLKVGSKTVKVPYTSAKKEMEKKVELILYKLKGLRGFLRRAAETRLLRLKEEGKVPFGPCTPTANYPHPEILEDHVAMGYHLQGTCKPMCLVRRLFGSLENYAAVKIFPPYIVKAMAENIPTGVTEYLQEKIGEIFGLDHCIVYNDGESTLKTETFNIINRRTDLAVNNFMKHAVSGTLPFKVVFSMTTGTEKELIENIGFFLDALFEINTEEGIQLGAGKNNGSGLVKIKVLSAQTNRRFAEIETFIKEEEKHVRIVEFGGIQLQETKSEYIIDPKFAEYALNTFKGSVGDQ
jgi:hypothetical protein